MINKNILIAIGLLALVVILGVINIWRFPKLTEIPKQSLVPFQESFQELKKGWEGLSPELPQNGYNEFISSDGRFKIKYPAHWLAIGEGNTFGSLAPPEWIEEYNLQTLFLAQNLQEGKFAQLIVYKGLFEISVEEVFEKMRENNENQGWTVEILDSDIKENEGIIEAKYYNSGTILHSKERILTAGNETYLISLISLEKEWEELKEKVSVVISSAFLTEPLK